MFYLDTFKFQNFGSFISIYCHLLPSKSKQAKAKRWITALNADTYKGDAIASMTLIRLQKRNRGGSTKTRKEVPKKPFNT